MAEVNSLGELLKQKLEGSVEAASYIAPLDQYGNIRQGTVKIKTIQYREVEVKELVLDEADKIALNALLFTKNYDENRYLKGQMKVPAIRYIRCKYGFGLKEGKDLIDTLCNNKSIDAIQIYG